MTRRAGASTAPSASLVDVLPDEPVTPTTTQPAAAAALAAPMAASAAIGSGAAEHDAGLVGRGGLVEQHGRRARRRARRR